MLLALLAMTQAYVIWNKNKFECKACTKMLSEVSMTKMLNDLDGFGLLALGASLVKSH